MFLTLNLCNFEKSAEPSALESLDTNAGAEQSERLRNLLEKGAPLGTDIKYFQYYPQ